MPENKQAPKKGVHDGHRKRLKETVLKDAELLSLSEIQLVEYYLGLVIPRKDTNGLAHALLEEFGSLYGIFTATAEELFRISGMTENAAHLLSTVLSVSRRVELSRRKRNAVLDRINDVVEQLKPHFAGRNQEMVYLMCIDVNDRVMQTVCVSRGSASMTNVQIGQIVEIAARAKACKAVLAHNHPGGNLVPSPDDIGATRSVILILEVIGIHLIDHIIFADDGYYSFHENDLMSKLYESTDQLLGTDRSREISSRTYVEQYVFERKPNRSYGELSARTGLKRDELKQE